MRIQIIMPKELVHQVDVYCTHNGYTRSEFIRNCIRSEIFSSTDPVTGKVDKPILIAEPSGVILTNGDPGDFKLPPMPKKVVKDMAKLQKTLSSMARMCKHGSAYGNCKFGCRPGKEVK